MQNSFHVQRGWVWRITWMQLVVACATAILALPWGWRAAAAALAAGVLVALGNVLMGLRLLTQGQPLSTLIHLLTGLLLRWTVILGGALVFLVVLRWPPLALLAGLTATLLAPLLVKSSLRP